MTVARKTIPPIVRIAKLCEVQDHGYETPCWIYVGYVGDNGYAVMTLGTRGDGTRRVSHVHRVAYELVIGPIPEGMHLDHLCRQRACCNPDHLEPVAPRENLMRGYGFAAINARKIRCDHGHDLSDAYEYRHRSGSISRHCRECWRIRAREKRAAKT